MLRSGLISDLPIFPLASCNGLLLLLFCILYHFASQHLATLSKCWWATGIGEYRLSIYRLADARPAIPIINTILLLLCSKPTSENDILTFLHQSWARRHHSNPGTWNTILLHKKWCLSISGAYRTPISDPRGSDGGGGGGAPPPTGSFEQKVSHARHSKGRKC